MITLPKPPDAIAQKQGRKDARLKRAGRVSSSKCRQGFFRARRSSVALGSRPGARSHVAVGESCYAPPDPASGIGDLCNGATMLQVALEVEETTSSSFQSHCIRTAREQASQVFRWLSGLVSVTGPSR